MTAREPFYGLTIQKGPTPKPSWQTKATDQKHAGHQPWVDSTVTPWQQKDSFTTKNSFWGERGVVRGKPTSYNQYEVSDDPVAVILKKIYNLLKGKRGDGNAGNGGGYNGGGNNGGYMLGRDPSNPHGVNTPKGGRAPYTLAPANVKSESFFPTVQTPAYVQNTYTYGWPFTGVKTENEDVKSEYYDAENHLADAGTSTHFEADPVVNQLFNLNTQLQNRLDQAHNAHYHSLALAQFMEVPGLELVEAALKNAHESGDYSEVAEFGNEMRSSFNRMIQEKAEELHRRRNRDIQDVGGLIRIAAGMNGKAEPHVRPAPGVFHISQEQINESNQTGFNLASRRSSSSSGDFSMKGTGSSSSRRSSSLSSLARAFSLMKGTGSSSDHAKSLSPTGVEGSRKLGPPNKDKVKRVRKTRAKVTSYKGMQDGGDSSGSNYEPKGKGRPKGKGKLPK